MIQLHRHLKVFLYHSQNEPNAVSALRTRLSDDGVDVLFPDDKRISPSGIAGSSNQLRNSAIRDAIQESDVVLVCLSRGSIRTATQVKKIKLVSEMILEKPQGDLFIIPVRFEECDVPESLKRWQAVELFEETGYGRLMQALKLRADKVHATLELKEETHVPFEWDKKKDLPQDGVKTSNVSFLTAGVVVFGIVLFFLLYRVFGPAPRTTIPVEVMLENLTQSALEKAVNRSLTQTAVSQSVMAPLTQTAAAIGTAQNPAPPTIQFPTIIALPTEIIAPGNIKMIFVPGDNVTIGNNNANAGAGPVHMVYLNPFYIDKYEVTNALYGLCVDAGGCEPPKNVDSKTHPLYYGNIEFDNYPMVNVDWYMAKQYCEWRGARLPVETEWEMAARSIDGRNYPWGNDLPACTVANYADVSGVCIGDTIAIGGYEEGQSLYGAFDMSGNVSEWVNSLYWGYPYSSTDGREDPDTIGLRVVRGGNWASSYNEITTYSRFSMDPSTYDPGIGFRCARDAGK